MKLKEAIKEINNLDERSIDLAIILTVAFSFVKFSVTSAVLSCPVWVTPSST
ncbi:hypothetical protein Q604_UNBc4C00222G0001, partial [human gut metagenome]